MTAYNFKKKWDDGSPTNFRQLILDGTKKHTIRPVRKHSTRAGYMLQLYQGQRTKNCEKIMVIPCLKVRPIIIIPWHYKVKIYDVELQPGTIELLAKNDGFNNVQKFFDFFSDQYDFDTLTSKLELIQWLDTPY